MNREGKAGSKAESLDSLPWLSESKNFFRLNPEELYLVKKRIRRSKGLVRLHMHPFYPYDFGDGYQKSPESLKADKTSPALLLGRLCQMPMDRTPVNLVLEVGSLLGKTAEQCNEWAADSKNFPLLVPTLPKRAVPDYPGIRGSYHQKRWDKWSGDLSELGVMGIIMSGNYSEFIYLPDNKNKTASLDSGKVALLGCVTDAWGQLSRRFSVEFSSATYPHNRRLFEKVASPNSGWPIRKDLRGLDKPGLRKK